MSEEYAYLITLCSFFFPSSLLFLEARIDASISNLDTFFRDPSSGVLSVTAEITSSIPNIRIPSLLEILLEDPQGILDTLNTALTNIEEATLGPKGIITTFKVSFIRKGLARALGAGTDNNILALGRRKILGALQEGLDSLEGQKDTVAEALGLLIEKALDSIGLLQEDENVEVDCYNHTESSSEPGEWSRNVVTCSTKDDDPGADSVQWRIPFGQSFAVELPMDFDLDTGNFPLEVEFSGDDESVPTLEIGWSFTLSFGFDEDEGFFVYSFPEDDEQEEFQVFALLSILNRGLDATLIFLKGSITDLDLVVGVKAFVDLDKGQALDIAESPTDRQYGRLTLAGIKGLPKISKLFSIGALAAATLSVEEVSFGLNTDFLDDDIAAWIPRLTATIGFQARKEIGILNRRRQLIANDKYQIRSRPDLESLAHHRAYPLLRSLVSDNEILDAGYNFDKCPLAPGENICAKVNNTMLSMKKIAEVLEPILTKFVRKDDTQQKGILDAVVDPQLLVLDARLPGISDIMGKKVTVLDIAEVFLGEKSG